MQKNQLVPNGGTNGEKNENHKEDEELKKIKKKC